MNNNFEIELPREIYLKHLKVINKISFSIREIDVISCILQGRSAKRIGSLLMISPKTVENHLRNIMLKIGCNSQESIIDFIEKSGQFVYIKTYYSNLLIKIAFESQLKKIIGSIKNLLPNCLIIYHKEEQSILPLIAQLQDHLKFIGIKPSIEVSQDENILVTSVNHAEYTIYCISNNFLKNIKNTLEKQNILQSEKSILLSFDTTTSIMLEKNDLFKRYIDITHNQRYYFALFEILKTLFPELNFEQNISIFKQYYTTLLKPTNNKLFIASQFNNICSIFQSILQQKRLILLGTLCLLFCMWLFYKKNQNASEDAKHAHNISSIYKKDFYQLKEPNDTNNTNNINVVEQEVLAINLPQRNNKFIGRQDIITKLHDQYKNIKSNNNNIIVQVLVGIGGIGKSQVATELAHILLERKDYSMILWITAESAETLYNSYSKFADYFNIDIKGLSLNDIQQLIHRKLCLNYKGGKILFLLDNAENNKLIHSLLTNLQQQSNNYFTSHVLITSRHQDWLGFKLLIETFTEQEAISFIKEQLPNEREESIIDLSKSLHYFPLALTQAVAYINAHSNIDDYLEAYNKNTIKYLDIKANDNYYSKQFISLWKIWDTTLSKLSKNAQILLGISSYLESDEIPIIFFNNFNVIERMKAIEELRKHSLITLVNGNKAFKIHRLLQDVIRIKNERNTTWLEKKNYLSKAIELINKQFEFNYLNFKRWAHCKYYLAHAKTLAEHAIKTTGNDFDQGVALYITVAMFMTHIILLTDQAETERMWSYLLKITKKYNNKLIDASINTHLANVKRVINKLDEAQTCFNLAIETYSTFKFSDTKIYNKNIYKLMNILRVFPLDIKKTSLYDQVQFDLAYTLTRCGAIFNYTLQDPNQYINIYEKAISILDNLEKVNNIKNSVQYQKVDLLNNLGAAYIHIGKLILAEEVLKQAKILAEKIYIDHRQQANNQLMLAQIYIYTGEFKIADQLIKSSLNILHYIFSEEHFIVNFLKGLIAQNYYMLKEEELAEYLLKKLVFFCKNYKSNLSNYWLLISKIYLARIYESKKKYEISLLLSQESLKLAHEYYKEHNTTIRSIKFKLSRAEYWDYIYYKDYNLEYWKKKLYIITQLFGEKHYETARSYQIYGQVLKNTRRFSEALQQYKKAKSILESEEINHHNLIKFQKQNMCFLQKLIDEISSVK